jgi:NADH-quinone oxidoreductase subunit N
VFLAILLLLIDLTDPVFNVLNGLLLLSPFNSFFEVLLLSFGCVVLLLNRGYYSVRGLFQYEFDIILVCSFLGLLVLCLSNDLLVVYVAIELQSLAFYVLATFWRSSEFSNEAGLKYFVLGALSSCFLLLGFSFIYLSLGSTSFDVLTKLSQSSENFELALIGIALTLTAFLFKLGSFPCHAWVCDVYEGALVSVSVFFSVIPKTVIFCLLFKLFFLTFSGFSGFWSIVFNFSGILSIFVSSVGALYQKRTKRLLAYSAIGHVGFILLAFSTGMIESLKVAVVYLFIYMVMNIGVFSLIMGFSSKGFLLKYLISWSFLKK